MRRLAALLVLAPFLFGFSTFSSYFDWQAAVGAHELETFDDVPDQGIPPEGGSITLDGFSIVADGNHSGDGDICSGLCSPKVEGGAFHGDVHGLAGDSLTFNQFVFDAPISAFALEFSNVEDQEIGVFGDGFLVNAFVDDLETEFIGVILDAPVSTLKFSAFYQNFTVDNLRWVSAESPVPEPSGALILALGLGLATAGRLATRT
jgi:hypothetical protein